MANIPHVIHYCWFGGKALSPFAKMCIASWKKFFPNYEIKEWNESNFDVFSIPYIKEAYSLKKYAFVSDFARFWILYNYGGLYFDTDVEIIKNMDSIVDAGPFMACELDYDDEKGIAINAGLGIGAFPKMQIYADIIEFYKTKHFLKDDGNCDYTTVVFYVTNLLKKKGLQDVPGIQNVCGINIFPKDYFCPMSSKGKIQFLTENTVSIHHFKATWLPKSVKIKKFIQKILGRRLTQLFVKVKHFFRRWSC